MITAAQMLKFDEGLKNKAYRDTVGKVTIGIGFNMDNPGARGIWNSTGILESFDDCYKGIKTLSPDSITKLLYKCVDIAKSDLKILFSEFDTFPENVQLALINLMFNMGRPTLSKFFTFNKFIKDKNYDRASDQLGTTGYSSQLPQRSKRVRSLLKGDDSEYIIHLPNTSGNGA